MKFLSNRSATGHANLYNARELPVAVPSRALALLLPFCIRFALSALVHLQRSCTHRPPSAVRRPLSVRAGPPVTDDRPPLSRYGTFPTLLHSLLPPHRHLFSGLGPFPARRVAIALRDDHGLNPSCSSRVLVARIYDHNGDVCILDLVLPMGPDLDVAARSTCIDDTTACEEERAVDSARFRLVVLSKERATW